jgi:hypothetical protein
VAECRFPPLPVSIRLFSSLTWFSHYSGHRRYPHQQQQTNRKTKITKKNKGLVEAEVTSALTFGAFFVILFFVEVGKKPLASDNAPPRVYTFSQEK